MIIFTRYMARHNSYLNVINMSYGINWLAFANYMFSIHSFIRIHLFCLSALEYIGLSETKLSAVIFLSIPWNPTILADIMGDYNHSAYISVQVLVGVRLVTRCHYFDNSVRVSINSSHLVLCIPNDDAQFTVY